jgi:hypothetical protein
MDDLMNMLASDESPADISDAIKNILHAKAAERIDEVRPYIAADMFGFESSTDSEEENDYEDED